MNDTLFVGSDTIVTLDHAKIPDMPAELFPAWPMVCLAFALGVLFTLLFAVWLGHRKTSKVERENARTMEDLNERFNAL